MPSANALKFNYDTGNFVPEDPDMSAHRFDPNYDNDNLRPIAAERGNKAITASEEGKIIEFPGATVQPADTLEASAELAATEASPEASAEADDLAGMPEQIRNYCLQCREYVANATPEESSFNYFAADPANRDIAVINRKTKNIKKITNNPDYWNEERRALQEYSINRQLSETIELSASMRAAERERGIGPTIYVLRGVSGSGKTYAAAHANLPGMIVRGGEPVGTVATDNSKIDLYKAGGRCDFIHRESAYMNAVLNQRLAEHVRSVDGDFSTIYDRVFDDPSDIANVIDDATETGRRIEMLDIDVPFVVSAVRVLQRPKESPEPHPGSDYLERITRNTRQGRTATYRESMLCDDGDPSHTGQLLRAVNDQGVDVSYRLLCYDYESEPKVIQREAAHLERDSETGQMRLVVTDEKLFHRATDAKEIEKEIAEVKDRVIDQAFVDWYCETFFDSDPASKSLADKVRADLAEYVERGLTIYEALDDKNK